MDQELCQTALVFVIICTFCQVHVCTAVHLSRLHKTPLEPVSFDMLRE